MNTISPWSLPGKGIFLHEVINDLLVTNTLKFARNRAVIVNEVQPDIGVAADICRVRELIGKILELLSVVVKNSVVSISAKNYSDIILIHFKESDMQIHSFVNNELNQIIPDAERLGGFLGMTSHRSRLMTISLTILNQKEPASKIYDRLSKMISTKLSRFDRNL